jgi:hypothetical protein
MPSEVDLDRTAAAPRSFVVLEQLPLVCPFGRATGHSAAAPDEAKHTLGSIGTDSACAGR